MGTLQFETRHIYGICTIGRWMSERIWF